MTGASEKMLPLRQKSRLATRPKILKEAETSQISLEAKTENHKQKTAFTSQNTALSTTLASRPSYFIWQGLQANGRPQKGKLIATNEKEAREDLKRQHIIVLRLNKKGPVKARALSAAEITLFSRQLASLLDAGIALLPALQVIAASQTRAALASIISSLARDIAQGLPFSRALAKYPENFNTMYCQLIALGEVSGELSLLLLQLADERERFAAQKSKLRAALSYPIGVLLVSLAITCGLMVGVVPTFEHIFNDFGASLPTATQAVLAISRAINKGLAPMCGSLAVFIVLLRWVLYRSKTCREMFKLGLDKLLLKLPLFGTLFKTLAIARWSRALSLLLQAGTPLAHTFDILKGIANNAVFYQATRDIERRVKRGERLTQAMQATGCFPASILQPMAVAEECAGLERLLKDLAAFNERQVDERIALLTSLVEPLIIVLLGALIGGLVIALYLPIIGLGQVV